MTAYRVLKSIPKVKKKYWAFSFQDAFDVINKLKDYEEQYNFQKFLNLERPVEARTQRWFL